MSPPAPLDVIFETLTSKHNVAAFRCEEPYFQQDLQKYALQNAATGYSQTTVAIERETQRVFGYFSLSMTSVQAGHLPPEATQGMPKYPVPGVLLAKLAVHIDVKGRGLGRRLLMLSMREALSAGKAVGWRFFVIDAFSQDKVEYYTPYGFKALPGNPLRLYMNAKMVARAVATPKPTAP